MDKEVMIEAIANVADRTIFHITYDSVFFIYSGFVPGFILAWLLCAFGEGRIDFLLYILMMFSWYILVFILLCIVEYDELMNKRKYK